MNPPPDLSAVIWRKARRSHDEGACVEVGQIPNTARSIALRDSKSPHGPVLVVPNAAFRRLLDGLRGQL